VEQAGGEFLSVMVDQRRRVAGPLGAQARPNSLPANLSLRSVAWAFMPGICSHLTSLDIPVSLASSCACSGVLLHCAPHDARTNTRHSAPDTSSVPASPPSQP